MTATLALEVARFLTMLVVISAILWYGKVRAARRDSGLNFVLAGFVLLFLGSLVDVADDYEWTGDLGRYLSSEWAVVFEKFVGYFGGYALLALGFLTWFPKTQSLARETEHRIRAEAQLAQSQKMEAVGHLTGGIAHDFNNLLAVILGNLELLRAKRLQGDEYQYIDAAIDASHRGAELTRNMLSFARKAHLEARPIDLNQVVAKASEWITRAIPKSIAVETSLLAELWQIDADPTSTESAVLNLIINARDAMPNGGRLTIETSNVPVDAEFVRERDEDILPGRYVMLAVSDTGVGIPKEDLQSIFDPFFTTKQIGSGLGLSMIQGFLKQSGGMVRVYSEVGEGTTFKLYFPARSRGARAETRIETSQEDVEVTGVKVLVAEDEDQVMRVICTMLREAGYTVFEARSGDEALTIFSETDSIDILLTDIVMPGDIQGPELAKRLRELRPELRAVFMSGYATEAAVHGNGLRPEDIRLMKPVSRSDLIQALQNARAEP